MTAPGTAPLIALRGAAFGYAGTPAVSGVDLTLYPGEVVALLGPNGAGKSTLVRGLLGLVEHEAGEVEILGEPLARFHGHHRLGYVPQRHTLGSAVRASVTEIVAVGRTVQRPWWRPASARDRQLVAQAIADVGLAGREDTEVSMLSGGQQRRVLIARALASQPEMLLMDEPTAGVDHDNQVVLAGVIAHLHEAGTAMLIVTHELAALRSVVTRVVCLESGGVDFDGTPDEYEEHQRAHGLGHHHGDEEPSGTATGLRAPVLPGTGVAS